MVATNEFIKPNPLKEPYSKVESMSVIVEKFIRCDGCHKNFGVDNRFNDAKEHRLHAKDYGWVYKNGRDYCNECKPTKE